MKFEAVTPLHFWGSLHKKGHFLHTKFFFLLQRFNKLNVFLLSIAMSVEVRGDKIYKLSFFDPVVVELFVDQGAKTK